MAVEVTEFLGITAAFSSPPMLRTLALARQVSQTDVSVLILGESGSGKEILARAIHHYSPRSANPWVDISCAVFPEHLVESELFGHEKGAFSGAHALKPGMFELANTGTLFLDEIGELDPRLQVKLLRVLDSGEYYRVGGTRKVKVDVRIVAATNRNLPDAMESGRFRADLYHRLAQVTLEAPPLRDRPEDILPIAQLFLEKYRPGAHFSSKAEEALACYTWPGNVRELRNAVVSSCALSSGGEIEITALPPAIATRRPGGLLDLAQALAREDHTADREEPSGGTLAVLERESILRALAAAAGHQKKAARILGISTRTLGRRLKQYGDPDRNELKSA